MNDDKTPAPDDQHQGLAEPGRNRRQALSRMAWAGAGAGVLFTLSGGVPRSLAQTSTVQPEPRGLIKENAMSSDHQEARPPLPPFTRETAIKKVRLAEDGWNSRDAAKVSLAYSLDTKWRNRAEFANNREEARAFLDRKWKKELDYRLIKELWAFGDNRIGVRYAYEWHDDAGNWFRSYGNENWEFGEDGLMQRRYASINDMPIKESERKFHWPLGRRPDDHPGLSDLGL